MSTRITITSRPIAPAWLTNPKAPQLYRVYLRRGDRLSEQGQSTGHSVIEALRQFDGRSSWHGKQVGPYRFIGHGCDYLLEPVYLRRPCNAASPVKRRTYFIPKRELVQRGLLEAL
jgi:hypothetical protein